MYTRKDLIDAERKTSSERAAIVLKYAESHNLADYRFSISSSYVCQSQNRKIPRDPVSEDPVCLELCFGTVLDQLEKQPPGATVCVFNFGTYLKGGGEFGNGFISTDEEKICQCSNLYPILNSKEIDERYYALNRKSDQVKPYGPRILYIPDVVFYGKDRDIRADVLTCSIPGVAALKKHVGNADTVMRTTMVHRFTTTLGLAYAQGIEILIMGCFGSEINGNDPWYSYAVLKKVVESRFKYCFRKIIVTTDDRRYFLISSGEERAAKKQREQGQ